MRPFVILYIVFLSFLALPAEGLCAPESAPDSSETDPLAPVRNRLMDQAFVVETDEDDIDESLNRISGDIDLGFAGPQYTYDSSSHGSAGALQRSREIDRQNTY